VAVGGVVEALDEVEEGASYGAHSESAADVVEDAVRAGLPRRLWRGHLLAVAGETLGGGGLGRRDWQAGDGKARAARRVGTRARVYVAS